MASKPTLDPSNLKEAFRELFPASDKWFNIGLQLELGHDKLAEIETRYAKGDERLREMLNQRLSQGGLTWELLVEALEDVTVNYKDLAKKISEKHITPPMRPPPTAPPMRPPPTAPPTAPPIAPPMRPPPTKPPIAPPTAPPIRPPSKKGRGRSGEGLPPPKQSKLTPPWSFDDPPTSKSEPEYYNESRFVLQSTLKNYRCFHCKRVPKGFFQCKCIARKVKAEETKKKVKDNTGLSCTACLHLPCANCMKTSDYERDKKREVNIRKLHIYCPNKEHGCEDKFALDGEEKHLKEKCLKNKCKYHKIGCPVEERGLAKEIHEKDLMKHFDLLVARVVELMDQRSSAPPRIEPTANVASHTSTAASTYFIQRPTLSTLSEMGNISDAGLLDIDDDLLLSTPSPPTSAPTIPTTTWRVTNTSTTVPTTSTNHPSPMSTFRSLTEFTSNSINKKK